MAATISQEHPADHNTDDISTTLGSPTTTATAIPREQTAVQDQQSIDTITPSHDRLVPTPTSNVEALEVAEDPNGSPRVRSKLSLYAMMLMLCVCVSPFRQKQAPDD